MARGVASNPLMLSLEAAVLLLVAAGVPAAALRDDMDAIRVPTHVRGERRHAIPFCSRSHS